MAANFGFVVNAAQAHAGEFAAHGAGDRLAERSLADAGRTDEAQDRRLAGGCELAHREILDDPALDLLKPIVVFIENAFGFGDIDRLLFGESPRQFDERIEISTDHAVLARGFRHPFEAAKLLFRLLIDLLRHLSLGDGFAKLLHLGGFSLTLAELALDRCHLLAQQHFALTLIERSLGLLADLVRQAQNLDALGEQPGDAVDARRDVDGLEDLLALLRLQIEICSNEIGKLAGSGDRLNGGNQFLRHLRQKPQSLDRLPLQIEKPRFDFGRAGVRLLDPLDGRSHEGPAGEEIYHPEPLFALADEMAGTVGARHIAGDIGDCSDAVEIERRGIGDLRLALHDDADLALGLHRLLSGGKRLRAADRDREHGAGKQYEIAYRQDDQRIGGKARRSAARNRIGSARN